ncbi:hypothetical protein LG197_03995 [Pseudomonas asiatica]|uniref:hypothetical protein n=1 Tax=Pseudomonas asiatica TaxID=2219225 RepID=UPI0023676CCA|nr:hypothetical protein [Pseudomonas asiatica]WDM89254.1 hypothetical protein LG197_03995 [Pseudomonas asiatica]
MTPAAEQCDAVSEPFTRTAENKALYVALTKAEGVLEISEQAGCAEPGYRLIRIDDRLKSVGDIEIALLDDAQSSVAYYDKVTLVSMPEIASRPIARNQVWRSASKRHSLALRDISQKVLFGYIARRYDLLLAESEVFGGGKFYWHRQVSRAIEAGLIVSVYEPVEQAFRSVSTQRELDDIQDHAWSTASPEPLLALVSMR